MKKVDYKELIMAMDELEKEKGIEKAYLIEALETALITAYKKSIDSEVNAKVSIDSETGEMHLFIIKTVVKEVENPDFEISLEDAKKIKKKYKLDEEVYIEIIPNEFGRIAAQTAKQIVIQKIKEAERNLIFSEYNDKKGSIVTGIIQKIDAAAIVLDLGKLEGIMPLKEQMSNEDYYINQKIKVYVISVERGYKGTPQAMVSRNHPEFVKKLLELEIPEIYEGIIEVKSVSRDAGSRSKVAVYSANPNIDPVGSCVGQKGIRIQNVINELKGEKIDIIEWSEDPAIFIAAALLPAKVLAVDIKEEKFSQVIVPDDQLSLAIGKQAQNVRLAAKLTGWKIDLKSETEFRKMIEQMAESEEQEVAEEYVDMEVEPSQKILDTPTISEEGELDDTIPESDIEKPKKTTKTNKMTTTKATKATKATATKTATTKASKTATTKTTETKATKTVATKATKATATKTVATKGTKTAATKATTKKAKLEVEEDVEKDNSVDSTPLSTKKESKTRKKKKA